MAKVKRFRPRRGKKSTLTSKNIVLLSGELIVEVPEAGVGKGKVKMKMGDGITPYNELPYAVDEAIPAQNSVIAFSTSETADNATLLNEISSGRKLSELWGSTKKLLSNFSTSITELNNKYNSFEQAKSTIINSALGKALSMTSTTTIATVASKISSIVNRGAWNGSITTSGGNVTIPVGYHNGSGKVTGPTLATLVGGNVSATANGHVLSGVTAYGKNGVKLTGSHTCPTLASLVGSSVNLDSGARMLSGYTAYGKNGTKYTGSIVSKTSGSTAVTGSGKYGYDNTNGFWMYIPSNAYYTTNHWINVPYTEASTVCGMTYKTLSYRNTASSTNAGTYKATKTGTHVFCFAVSSGDSAVRNRAEAQAYIGSSKKAEYNPNNIWTEKAWVFSLSLTKDQVVTFKTYNEYSNTYVVTIHGIVAY